jgi:hypothetical protein
MLGEHVLRGLLAEPFLELRWVNIEKELNQVVVVDFGKYATRSITPFGKFRFDG